MSLDQNSETRKWADPHHRIHLAHLLISPTKSVFTRPSLFYSSIIFTVTTYSGTLTFSFTAPSVFAAATLIHKTDFKTVGLKLSVERMQLVYSISILQQTEKGLYSASYSTATEWSRCVLMDKGKNSLVFSGLC